MHGPFWEGRNPLVESTTLPPAWANRPSESEKAPHPSHPERLQDLTARTSSLAICGRPASRRSCCAKRTPWKCEYAYYRWRRRRRNPKKSSHLTQQRASGHTLFTNPTLPHHNAKIAQSDPALAPDDTRSLTGQPCPRHGQALCDPLRARACHVTHRDPATGEVRSGRDGASGATRRNPGCLSEPRVSAPGVQDSLWSTQASPRRAVLHVGSGESR